MKILCDCEVIPATHPGTNHFIRNGDKSISPCFLRRGHDGPHILRRSDGKLIKWEHDYECECCSLDNQECFFYGEVSDQYALALLINSRE